MLGEFTSFDTGIGRKQLDSDHDEAVFDASRPLMLSAIRALGAARPDFLGRAQIIEFLPGAPRTQGPHYMPLTATVGY
jgi:hypothetical protein